MKKITRILSLLMVSVLMLTACSPKLSSDTVVSIDGVEISKEYFDKTVAKVAKDNDFEAVFGDQIWDMEIEPGVTFSKHFSEQMLEMIITHELVMQKLEKDDPSLIATDEEIEAEYSAYMDIVSKDEEYASFLTEHGIDEEFIKDHLRKNLSYRKFASNAVDSVEVTDEEIEKYYQEHLEDYSHNEVRASHILISTLDDNGEVLADDQKAQKLELSQEILQKAKAGEDFAALAKEYSEDPGSAVDGGDLGFFPQGVMVAEFNDKAFSMEIGEISDIVETSFGYHIIYLTDKLDEVESLDDVSYMIGEQLKNEAFDKQLQELNAKAKISVNTDLVDVNI